MANMKIPAEFDEEAYDLVERFAKSYDEKKFNPYSFPKDYFWIISRFRPDQLCDARF